MTTLFAGMRLVVLVAPAALGSDQAGPLLAAHGFDPSWSRILLRADTPAELALAVPLRASGFVVEVLSAAGAPGGGCAMPAGTSARDADEYALALADTVLVGQGGERSYPAERAAALKKVSAVDAGRAAPGWTVNPRLAALDPAGAAGARKLVPNAAGAVEQSLLVLAAALGNLVWGLVRRPPAPPLTQYCRRGGLAAFRAARRHDKLSDLADVWASIRKGVFPVAYRYPPEDWKPFAPDPRLMDGSGAIVRAYDVLDRSATAGARLHRDIIWVTHIAAAFAVFAAVAGAIHLGGGEPGPVAASGCGPGGCAPVAEHSHAWAWTEIVLLTVFVLLPVVYAISTRLQQRWMACRLGAEQLRVAMMALPLALLPASFQSRDDVLTSSAGDPDPPAEDEEQPELDEFSAAALGIVKRAAREQGLPRQPAGRDHVKGAGWVKAIVDDQQGYHARNHRKLERAEWGFRIITVVVFILSLIAVILHFFVSWEWLLLATAFGPAAAAAAHGIGTRLDIVHRGDLSRDSARSLRVLSERLDGLIKASATLPVADFHEQLRGITLEAARVLGEETERWHRLVLLQEVSV